MIQKQITLAQAVALLAERGYRSSQGKPYATSTLQKAAREGRLECQMIGKTYVTTPEEAVKWAEASKLHNPGPPVRLTAKQSLTEEGVGKREDRARFASRAKRIAKMYTSGTPVRDISAAFGISRQRVHQILNAMGGGKRTAQAGRAGTEE